MLLKLFYNTFVYYLLFNFVYYLSSGILFLIDYFNFFPHQKIQSNSKNLMDSYKKCLSCVIKNTLLYPILPIFLFTWYETTEEKQFDIIKCVLDIIFTMIIADILFYTIHRVFHIPLLYKYFHKKHHQIVAPIGISAVYMTPVDLYIGNILPIYIPLLVLGAHPITTKIWIIITTVNTIIFAHSGFKGIADFHDGHHSLFNKNYGTNLFMDKLFGTYHK